jgi:hypothetical protein
LEVPLMAKTVYVTRAQRDAARLKIKIDAKLGRVSRPSVIKIANAKPAAATGNDAESSTTTSGKN